MTDSEPGDTQALQEEQVQSAEDEAANATRADLEKLNGLLIRTLIQRLEGGSVTSTDIGSAVKVLISNRVQPSEDQGGTQGYRGGQPFTPGDFPFPI